MAIREETVEIRNGTGGPNDDSIPAYGDKNAPNGAWAYDATGLRQLMLQNGTKLIRCNLSFLTAEEAFKFYSFKDGKPNYARVWLIDPETGRGFAGPELWVENNKLFAVVEVEPEPPTPPAPTEEIVTVEVLEVRVQPGGQMFAKIRKV